MSQTLRWLFAPIQGTRRWRPKILELIRSIFTGSAILVFLDALTNLSTHLDILRLPKDETEVVAKYLAFTIGLSHLLMQFYQQDPHAPRSVAPTDPPVPPPATLPASPMTPAPPAIADK